MPERFLIEDREEFLAKLRALLGEGVSPGELLLHLPFEVPEVEEILGLPPSRTRLFALAGALGGFGGGLAFTIYTALDWPLVTGGKPIVSLPPFLIIAYLMTILFGSLGAFAGFLFLARLPRRAGVAEADGAGGRFVIEVHPGRRRP